MKVRADVAELLRAGHSDAAVARQLSLPIKTVTAARTTLHLPKYRRGRRSASSAEDLFWLRTQPTSGGHLLWTGHLTNGTTPTLRHKGRFYSAYRIAFRIKHGREAEGRVTPGCTVAGCVHPNHVDDRAMRERTEATFTAIFKGAS